MVRVLVTGANGFLGRHVAAHLLSLGMQVRSAVRVGREAPGEIFEIEEIAPATNWTVALKGCDAVVHAAAVVHRLASEVELQRVNVAGTIRLAEQSAAAGIPRFIFISSAGVFGAGRDTPYSDADAPAPVSAYAKSKWQAEQALATVRGIETLALRLPMIYGREAPGNFTRLRRLVRTGLPLPLGSIHNRRSLIHVVDAAAAVAATFSRFRAGNYAVTGPDDISTPDLARGIAEASGKASRLFPFPPAWIEMAARLSGRGPEIAALTRSFTLDTSRFQNDFGWRPAINVAEGLGRSVK